MRLRPGTKYYENRWRNEQPVLVKHGDHVGVVTRATPSGNHIPPQAYVVFELHELWIPTRELEYV